MQTQQRKKFARIVKLLKKNIMKSLMNLVVGVLLVSMNFLFVGCSNADDNNIVEVNPKMVVSSVNLEKNWIAVHFAFSEKCESAQRSAYQKSSLEISVEGERFYAIDQYSLKEYAGSWKLIGKQIVVDLKNGGEPLRYDIVELKKNELIVQPLDHSDLVEIELVSFDK